LTSLNPSIANFDEPYILITKSIGNAELKVIYYEFIGEREFIHVIDN